jgi:ribosomal protein L20
MGAMKKNSVLINIKILAEIAATDFEGFKAIKNSLK